MSDRDDSPQDATRSSESTIGEQIKYWRNRGRISQMDLALDCDSSSRHLSFVETGRAHPSRKLMLALTRAMQVPLRARNTMLVSAGYAQLYEETGLSEPEMDQVRSMLQMLVRQNDPFPSMLIDRHWDILEANRSFYLMCETFVHNPELLKAEPLNLVRCFLNPECLGNSVVNYAEMFDTMVNRAKRLVNVMGNDPDSQQLLEEVASYNLRKGLEVTDALPELVMPLRLKKGDKEVSLFTMVATMGAPLDVTLQELQLELGLPMDEASDAFLRNLVKEAAGRDPE